MTVSALLAALFVGSFFHIDLGPKIESPLAYNMPPAYVMTVSADLKEGTSAADPITPETAWWKLFNEPVLDRCIDEAFAKNRDLEHALAVIAQARASFKIARGNQRPSLSVGVDISRSYVLGDANGTANETNTMDPAAGMSYEMDLWGKLQKATRAAKENIIATEAAKNAIRLALASEVAKNYFSLRATDKQILIAEANLLSQKQTLELTRYMYEHGQVSELDLRRSEALVHSTEIELQRLQLALSQYENSLLLLMGSSPEEFAKREIPRGVNVDELPPCPEIPEDLPVRLLVQRPDIIEAEYTYRTALANIGSARAEQYPAISFTGLIGNLADSPQTMFSGPSGWSAAAAFLAPIFNGGKLQANVKRNEAIAQQALASYYKTVQTAMKETLDAIAANQRNAEIVNSVIAQEIAQRRAYELAQIQYIDGSINQLDLLDAQRNLLSVQLEVIGDMSDRLNAAVSLCQALGGGWKYRADDDLEMKPLARPWAKDAARKDDRN
ncbi:MAG: efflux transporter outer membrane subunit [Synergistes sp.]|nr:efflux transporter outer membrane subunit [Synergistes sp.]